MFSTASSIYGSNLKTRSVAAQLAVKDRHRFLVGTCSVRDQNEIHLLDFDEDDNEIRCLAIWSHPAEVLSLCSSPGQQDIICTAFNSGGKSGASIWRLPKTGSWDGPTTASPSLSEDGDGDADPPRPRSPKPASPAPVRKSSSSKSADDTPPLEQLASFPLESKDVGPLKTVVWNPSEESGLISTVQSKQLRLWRADGGHKSLSQVGSWSGHALSAVSFDPHHGSILVAADGRALRQFDFRDNKETLTIPNAHQLSITDVDFNPNKPYHLVTSSEDRSLRVWDLRKPSAPLKVCGQHSHWVSSVKYNPSHDQLIISAGTDSHVNLWSLVSVSSAPLGDLEDIQNVKEGDRLVKSYDEHEDSVYSVAWSACDAWVFASLSYDGRLAVNHVPPAEKYKILL